MNTLKTMRNALLWAMMFAGAGAYAGYDYEHKAFAAMRDEVSRGWCGANDHKGNFYWFNCQDSFIAAQLQEHDAQAAADPIADLIRASEKKGKRK